MLALQALGYAPWLMHSLEIHEIFLPPFPEETQILSPAVSIQIYHNTVIPHMTHRENSPSLKKIQRRAKKYYSQINKKIDFVVIFKLYLSF